MFYIAQVFGALGWIFLLVSFWKSGSKKLLYLQLIACALFAVNYGLLGAFSGMLIVLLELFRDFLYIKVKDKMKIFYMVLPCYLLISIFINDGLISLFSVAASICDSYALTRKNKEVVAIGILTYALWLIYDLSFESYSTVIAEIFLIISNIVVLIKYRNAYFKSDKLFFSRGMIYNSKIVDEIHKLDKDNYDSDFTWSKEKLDSIIKSRKTDFIIIHDNEDVIGYINFITISKAKYNHILKSNKYVDINTLDINIFSRKNENYICIDSIAIKINYQNDKTVRLISDAIYRYLSEKINSGFKISGVITITLSEFENNIFVYSNFIKQEEKNPDFTIYTLNEIELRENMKRFTN